MAAVASGFHTLKSVPGETHMNGSSHANHENRILCSKLFRGLPAQGCSVPKVLVEKQRNQK